jgi:hypothetical protein
MIQKRPSLMEIRHLCRYASFKKTGYDAIRKRECLAVHVVSVLDATVALANPKLWRFKVYDCNNIDILKA